MVSTNTEVQLPIPFILLIHMTGKSNHSIIIYKAEVPVLVVE